MWTTFKVGHIGQINFRLSSLILNVNPILKQICKRCESVFAVELLLLQLTISCGDGLN